MKDKTISTLMGILAIYSDFVRKGLLRGTKGKMPVDQQKAIDDFAQTYNCEIFWDEKNKVHLWSVKDA